MSSYHHTRYEHLAYNSNGGAESWSDDGYGYGKGMGGARYGNSSIFGSAGNGYYYDRGFNNTESAAMGDWGHHGGGYGYGSNFTGNADMALTRRPQWIRHDKAPSMMATTVVEEGPDLISALVPTSFPPGTDPKLVECFNRMDRDGNGSICDQELQAALSTFDQRFSLRTVHLLMYLFTGSSSNAVGPKEFVPLVNCLQQWKARFSMYDRNRNGSIDERELKEALMNMGYNLSPLVLRLLMSKFDKSGAKTGIQYDYFIECCIVIKGLTERFKTMEDPYTRTATFTYNDFLVNVLPFVVMN